MTHRSHSRIKRTLKSSLICAFQLSVSSSLGNDLPLCCKKFLRHLAFNSTFEEKFHLGAAEKTQLTNYDLLIEVINLILIYL